MMNAVGGTSIHYWAQSWRLNPWDFKVRSETVRRYGASRLPKGSTIEDWPFDYNELEQYYDKVEYAIGVSGQAGNLNGRKDERGPGQERRGDQPSPDEHERQHRKADTPLHEERDPARHQACDAHDDPDRA